MILNVDLFSPLSGAGLSEPAFAEYSRRQGRKLRRIHSPNDAMRIVHWGLCDYLLQALGFFLSDEQRRISTAYWPESSMLANASQHAENRFFYVTDLVDAYGSVRGDQLAIRLCDMDPSLRVSLEDTTWTKKRLLAGVREFLRTYCLTRQGGLRFGGPASPLLFNLYAGWELDLMLLGAAQTHGLTVTRFADDIVFSSREHISQSLRHELLTGIRSSGFTPNERKTWYRDLLHEAVTITGVRLKWRGTNGRSELSATPELQKQLRSLLSAWHKNNVNDPWELGHLIKGLWAAIHALGGGHGEAWQRTTSLYRSFLEHPLVLPFEEHQPPRPELLPIKLWSGRTVFIRKI